ncbi:MAG: hypothetical protein JXR44_07630 [Thiotrichales bacterium]|nr:hypothetical protein [Thiotrichales bacterium]
MRLTLRKTGPIFILACLGVLPAQAQPLQACLQNALKHPCQLLSEHQVQQTLPADFQHLQPLSHPEMDDESAVPRYTCVYSLSPQSPPISSSNPDPQALMQMMQQAMFNAMELRWEVQRLDEKNLAAQIEELPPAWQAKMQGKSPKALFQMMHDSELRQQLMQDAMLGSEELSPAEQQVAQSLLQSLPKPTYEALPNLGEMAYLEFTEPAPTHTHPPGAPMFASGLASLSILQAEMMLTIELSHPKAANYRDWLTQLGQKIVQNCQTQ